MTKYPKIQSIFKRNPDDNYKTFLEGEYSTEWLEYLKDNIWYWSEKIDGCLHYGNNIITEQGSMPIGRIVEKKLPIRILSYNVETKILEYKKIKHYHKEERCRPFLSVGVKSRKKGNRIKHIVCTDNHKFYSNGEWIEAKNLKIGQLVSHNGYGLTCELKQLILGGLLGDSSIYRPSKTTRGFEFTHSIKQNDYFEYKKRLLGNLFKEGRKGKGGFESSLPNRNGGSIINNAISDLIIEYCEKNNKKYVTKKWVNELMPLGLAIWYMDDGSAVFNKKQRARVWFATNSFNLSEVNLLKKMFKDKWNIDSTIHNYKGWVLRLTADGSEKFFSLIFPYIPDSMKYKLPKKYRKYPCVLTETLYMKPVILDTEVVSVSEKLPKTYQGQQLYQYDLSVEDNSNYFAHNILVHNTNIRVLWYSHPLMVQHVVFKGRTDKAQIPTFLLAKLNKIFTEDKMLKVFKIGEGDDAPDVCLYGEGYGARINKGEKYISRGVDFILFDIRIGDWWLKRRDIEEIAEKLGIKVVPIVGKGTLDDAIELIKSGTLKSQWGDFLAEGMVLKPEVELRARNGNRIITKVKHKDYGITELIKS